MKIEALRGELVLNRAFQGERDPTPPDVPTPRGMADSLRSSPVQAAAQAAAPSICNTHWRQFLQVATDAWNRTNSCVFKIPPICLLWLRLGDAVAKLGVDPNDKILSKYRKMSIAEREQVLRNVEDRRLKNYGKIERRHNREQDALAVGTDVLVNVPRKFQRSHGFGKFFYTAVVTQVSRKGLYTVWLFQFIFFNHICLFGQVEFPSSPSTLPTPDGSCPTLYARNKLRRYAKPTQKSQPE